MLDDVDHRDASRKALATLQAVAALSGLTVDPIEGDNGGAIYALSGWGRTRQCGSVEELRGVLRSMGIDTER